MKRLLGIWLFNRVPTYAEFVALEPEFEDEFKAFGDKPMSTHRIPEFDCAILVKKEKVHDL